MTSRRTLLRDSSGASALEFALAIPILISMFYGIFTIGQLFEANAGMQHALGEAARYATIYPTPTDTQLTAKVTAKKFGTANGTLGALSIDNSNLSNGYKTLSLTYSQPMRFLFFTGPTVTLRRSKVVYVAS